MRMDGEQCTLVSARIAQPYKPSGNDDSRTLYHYAHVQPAMVRNEQGVTKMGIRIDWQRGGVMPNQEGTQSAQAPTFYDSENFKQLLCYYQNLGATPEVTLVKGNVSVKELQAMLPPRPDLCFTSNHENNCAFVAAYSQARALDRLVQQRLTAAADS